MTSPGDPPKRNPSLEPGFLTGDDDADFDEAPPAFLPSGRTEPAPPPPAAAEFTLGRLEDGDEEEEEAWAAFTGQTTAVTPPVPPAEPPVTADIPTPTVEVPVPPPTPAEPRPAAPVDLGHPSRPALSLEPEPPLEVMPIAPPDPPVVETLEPLDPIEEGEIGERGEAGESKRRGRRARREAAAARFESPAPYEEPLPAAIPLPPALQIEPDDTFLAPELPLASVPSVPPAAAVPPAPATPLLDLPLDSGETPSVSAARWRSDAGEYEDHGWEEITAEFRALQAKEDEESSGEEPAAGPAVATISLDDDLDEEPVEPAPAASAPGPGRNLPVAVAVGLALGLLAVGLVAAGRPWWATLVVLVVMFCLVEFYTGVRRANFRPAAAPGLLGVLIILLGTYRQGSEALGFGLTMVTVFCLLWYLLGVIRAHPVANLGITLLGVLYVGFLGSFAIQITQYRDWSGITLGYLAVAVASDVGGYAAGYWLGRHHPFPRVSPSKSIEGLAGGAVLSIVVAEVAVARWHPWATASALGLAVVVAVAAPLGDLIESMLKRAVGVKDLGSILPGHGGLIDRIDSILMVLPAVFYFVQIAGVSPFR